ncbi:MAG: glycoside hydrolase family 127 protein, partial [Propionibacterium sp.]|nr:glycoside hydrolase family 127 protein [Propionibacterium sp.]
MTTTSPSLTTDHETTGTDERPASRRCHVDHPRNRPATVAPVVPGHSALLPLGIDEVALGPGFWGERQEVNATATIPHCEHWEERVGWIGNFALTAAGRVGTERRGREFVDSDVHKLLEAMSWEVGRAHDPALEADLEVLAATVASAQDPDGYLNTRFGHEGEAPRYSDLEWGHELYCYGHLIQAGVARLRTGHDDDLTRTALRAADHVCDVFGEDGIRSLCGHPEIEMALVEMYRVTGQQRYLDQARLFVDRRGRGTLGPIEFGPQYFQDDIPFREAPVLRGHAVRALYLCAGAIDVAVETGDAQLLAAARRQYDAALARRTYITGGMGSHHQDEAFGEDFELPPDRSYCETCAGIASVMVAWRLLLATGETTYADVIERTLFNVVATSPSSDGRSFFYANPLQKRTPGRPVDPDAESTRASTQLRAPWFEVSCCPTNISRTLASLGAYVAALDEGGIRILQYTPAEIRTHLSDGRPVALRIDSDYPTSGRVRITVLQAPPRLSTISLRIPAWASGARLDGAPVEAGEARVEREFHEGDVLELDLALSPRITRPDDRIDAVRGCVAVERGPLVMCAESTELDGRDVADILLDPSGALRDEGDRVVVHGAGVLHREAPWPYSTATGAGAEVEPGAQVGAGAGAEAQQRDDVTEDAASAQGGQSLDLALIPYHRWGEKGPSTMRV